MAKAVTGTSSGNFGTYASNIVPPAFGGPTPPVPLSTVPVVNGTGQIVTVVITGGTMSNVSVDGNTAGAGAGTYTVRDHGTITLTYTVAPTWAWSTAVPFTRALNADGSQVSKTGHGG